MVETSVSAPAAHQPTPAAAPSTQRRTGLRWYVGGALLLLLAGAVAGIWAVDRYFHWQRGTMDVPPVHAVAAKAAAPLPAAPIVLPRTGGQAAPGDLAARITLLEARLAAVSVSAESLSGNAARAEGLLIAFAVRRALDRGLALGTLESQLRLRFADGQPNAVQTVIAAAAAPVTLDRLQTELDRLAPVLAGRGESDSLWTGLRREVGELFVLRDASAPSTRVDDRLTRARRLIDAGIVDGAMREVAALPGAAQATTWLEEAKRYHDARRALDLIETAAILAPQDGAGAASPVPPPRQ